VAHVDVGWKRNGIPKKSFSAFIFFVMVVLGVVLPTRMTFAHDAPTIAPTRLDFDARQMPKACNDDTTFRTLLANWVKGDVLSDQADRQLSVRIHRSPTGAKLADVKLVDTAGATIGEYHERFAVKIECHRVLYETAAAAAKLLGAFNEPPPPEPCPICPPPPAPVEPVRCPSCPVAAIAPPRIKFPVMPRRRAFMSAGVFFGTGITREGAIGPYGMLGFVLTRHVPSLQFEFSGAWSTQTLPQSTRDGDVLHADTVPVAGSLCYSRYVFRICGGLAATFFVVNGTNPVPSNDEFRMTVGANLQLGTEFEVTGPFSIRSDVFARLRFAERSFGQQLAQLDTLNGFVTGMVVMGVWSLE